MPRRRSTAPATTAAAKKPAAPAKKDTGKVKAVILADGYAYHEVSGDPSTPRVDVRPPEGSNTAKGIEIEVSQAEFDRGAAMTPPALAKVDSPEAQTGLAEVADDSVQARFAGLTDADLAAVVEARGEDAKGKSRDELLAVLTD
jgi:hypothetical protein